MVNITERADLTWAWKLAVASFVLAAGTGAFLRYAMIRGAPWGLHLQDVRHAHSHFMYFGWATPALMTLILSNLARITGRPVGPGARHTLAAIFLLAFLAYVSFLLSGYRPALIAGRPLPLATIAAGLNIIAWYVFVYCYWRQGRGVPRSLPLRLWDAALAFLVFSSLGAWGLAFSTSLNIESPLVSSAMTHLFLDLFADGWFLLALLGLAFIAMGTPAQHVTTRLGENLLVVGLPLTFFLSVPDSLLPLPVRLLAGLGALLAAAGLFLLLTTLLRTRDRLSEPAQMWLWTISLSFLVLKALALLVVAFPPGADWSLRMGLRVSYLHWLLLGGVSLGLIAAARHRWGASLAPGWRFFLLTVILVILSLVPLSGLFPASWKGLWTFQAATWAATGPVLAALWMLSKALWATRVANQNSPTADLTSIGSNATL